jgi:glycosyltransferase involved in cell wall biosynthesis
MTVVGGDAPPELVAMGAKDPNFRVTGFVDDVRPYISKAAVYVVPIRVGGGTRLKVLDAMAMGKAIVSHSIGCEGIEVEHDRDIVMADTAEETANAIIELFNDSARRDRIAANARLKAEHKYDWGVIAPVLTDAYEQAKACKK